MFVRKSELPGPFYIARLLHKQNRWSAGANAGHSSRAQLQDILANQQRLGKRVSKNQQKEQDFQVERSDKQTLPGEEI